ncbi:MAG: hypothetical protein HY392_02010 [Candidatus Diapherotrites archaeon]|nr:hypothetical protein [Candidatus Diapherotrites archaeon]
MIFLMVFDMKKFGGLKKFAGIFKDDKEYDEVLKQTKAGWAFWTKKYSRENK